MKLEVDGPRWHIACTEPNAEKKAKTFLESKGYTARWLRFWGRKMNHGRKVKTLLSFLPGYVFVEFDISKAQWIDIRGLPGCTGMVMRGGRSTRKGIEDSLPAALTPDQAERLFKKCDANDIVLLDHISSTWISKQTPLRLTEGPFKDIAAIFDEADERNRVWILLECLGVQQRVRVPEDWCHAAT